MTRQTFLLIMLASAGLPTIGFSQTYSTRFEGAEFPLSEGGRWTNNSVDWAQISKANGLAFGTQSGTNTGVARYNDSLAHLSGFPPDQEAWGQVHVSKTTSGCYQEVEILLRVTSSAHSTTGYECFGRCRAESYLQIVRWDGPLGKYTYLADMRGTDYGLKDGDILKASVVGDVITLYVNGVEKAHAKDSTFKTGNPGIGEFLQCGKTGEGFGANPDYGFSNFTARALRTTNPSPGHGQ